MEAMKIEDKHLTQIEQHVNSKLKIVEHQNRTDRNIEHLLLRLDSHIELTKQGFHNMEKRFEQIDKRFEQIDKRFEQVDKRFEQVDKRFEQMQHNMDKRFELMQHNMDKRFEQVDKRFDQMQNHIDRRFDQLIILFKWQTGIFTTFFIIIFGKLINI